ncbi:MAG: ImmA/IrrE family metallo-endopeptidase [Roseburia sp.]|nr:ImmA/IrrE family metallo-endopeptidase [Roseburia sp.]
MNKIPQLAQTLRKFFSHGTMTDVYGICKQLGIEIIEESIEADAYLQCENGSSFIVLKKTLNEYRKKFTIAHELGHFYIPWHSELIFGCDIKEMDFENDYTPREKEANLFAAELLMPEEEFKNKITGKISYVMVSELANIFGVSFQAALNRCIDLTNEDCIAVCSKERDIKWFRATEDFPLFLNRKKVNELSVADELSDLKAFHIKTVKEQGYIWFSNADDKDIEEESIVFPTYNEVISIIHLEDEL